MLEWVITDTHFNHAKMCDFTGRPTNFNNIIVSKWNKNVKPDDIVFHLGDVIIGRDAEIEQILRLLNGKKILIRGNHDKKSCAWYMSKGFDFACDALIYKGILFTHEPAKELPAPALVNVHGHTHANGHRPYTKKDFHIEFSIEGSLRPHLLNEIITNRLREEPLWQE